MSSFFASNFEEFFKEVASKNYKDINELGSSIDKILFEKDIFKKFLYLLLVVYIDYLKDLVPKFEEKFKPIKIPLKEFESKSYRNEVGAPSESIFDASKIDSIKILYYFMLYLNLFLNNNLLEFVKKAETVFSEIFGYYSDRLDISKKDFTRVLSLPLEVLFSTEKNSNLVKAIEEAYENESQLREIYEKLVDFLKEESSLYFSLINENSKSKSPIVEELLRDIESFFDSVKKDPEAFKYFTQLLLGFFAFAFLYRLRDSNLKIDEIDESVRNYLRNLDNNVMNHYNSKYKSLVDKILEKEDKFFTELVKSMDLNGLLSLLEELDKAYMEKVDSERYDELQNMQFKALTLLSTSEEFLNLRKSLIEQELLEKINITANILHKFVGTEKNE